MLGAIGGDIAGSIYEYRSFKGEKTLYEDIKLFTKQCRITDDTILTLAIADAILNKAPYKDKLREYVQKYTENPRYPKSPLFFPLPFSKNTIEWSKSNYRGESHGNGAPMRISAIPLLFNKLDKILDETIKATIPTHNSFEAIRGSMATATVIYLAKNGEPKEKIKKFIEKEFGYCLDYDLKDLQQNYKFYQNCDNTVPQAIFTFLTTDSYEECLRTTISIGGDTDTNCCIAGAFAENYYGLTETQKTKIVSYLSPSEKEIVEKVYQKKTL